MIKGYRIVLSIGTILLGLVAANMIGHSLPILAKPVLVDTPAATMAGTAVGTEAPEVSPCEKVRTMPMGGGMGMGMATAAATMEGTAMPKELMLPSNPGGPGPALDRVGDPKAGADVYIANCILCHGPEGKGGVENPGATEKTMPSLNPLDEEMPDKDPKVYACNLDLFIEHGSTPEGTNPQQTMPAFGDEKKLTPQQIADVIAYIISLNPLPVEATAAPTAAATP